MARPIKQGLDYFPLDTDFFNDDKMQLIEAEFGIKGTVVAIRLLCKIYNNGYFYQWGGDECLLFARAAGAEFVPSTVNEIVNGLVRRRFFDKGCFDSFGILTSQAIQRRYMQAVQERRGIDIFLEYWLLEEPKNDRFNVIRSKNPVNRSNNEDNRPESTQSKVKESKVKKRKGEKDNAQEREPSPKIPKNENYLKFQKWILDNAPNVAKLKEPFTEEQFERIKQDFPLPLIQEVTVSMHNYKELLKKYVSANLTFRKWAKRDLEKLKENEQRRSNTGLVDYRPDNRRTSAGTDAERKRAERDNLGKLADAILQFNAAENNG